MTQLKKLKNLMNDFGIELKEINDAPDIITIIIKDEWYFMYYYFNKDGSFINMEISE